MTLNSHMTEKSLKNLDSILMLQNTKFSQFYKYWKVKMLTEIFSAPTNM